MLLALLLTRSLIASGFVNSSLASVGSSPFGKREKMLLNIFTRSVRLMTKWKSLLLRLQDLGVNVGRRVELKLLAERHQMGLRHGLDDLAQRHLKVTRCGGESAQPALRRSSRARSTLSMRAAQAEILDSLVLISWLIHALQCSLTSCQLSQLLLVAALGRCSLPLCASSQKSLPSRRAAFCGTSLLKQHLRGQLLLAASAPATHVATTSSSLTFLPARATALHSLFSSFH